MTEVMTRQHEDEHERRKLQHDDRRMDENCGQRLNEERPEPGRADRLWLLRVGFIVAVHGIPRRHRTVLRRPFVGELQCRIHLLGDAPEGAFQKDRADGHAHAVLLVDLRAELADDQARRAVQEEVIVEAWRLLQLQQRHVHREHPRLDLGHRMLLVQRPGGGAGLLLLLRQRVDERNRADRRAERRASWGHLDRLESACGLRRGLEQNGQRHARRQVDADEFARRAHRERRGVHQDLEPLAWMQAQRAILTKLAQRRPLTPCLGDHAHADDLLQRRVGHREGGALRYLGMCHQHVFDLRGCNRLASTLDSLLRTPGDEQVAIGVKVAVVARLEPAVVPDAHASHALATVGVPCHVSAEKRATAHGDCTDLPVGQSLASSALDLHRGADRYARRSGLLQCIRRGRRRQRHAFRHSVGGCDRDEAGFPLGIPVHSARVHLAHLGRESSGEAAGRVRDVAQLWARLRRVGDELVEIKSMHRRGRIVPRRSPLASMLPKRFGREAAEMGDRAAREDGGNHAAQDAADVVQRHLAHAEVFHTKRHRRRDAKGASNHVLQQVRYELLLASGARRLQQHGRVLAREPARARPRARPPRGP